MARHLRITDIHEGEYLTFTWPFEDTVTAADLALTIARAADSGILVEAAGAAYFDVVDHGIAVSVPALELGPLNVAQPYHYNLWRQLPSGEIRLEYKGTLVIEDAVPPSFAELAQTFVYSGASAVVVGTDPVIL